MCGSIGFNAGGAGASASFGGGGGLQILSAFTDAIASQQQASLQRQRAEKEIEFSKRRLDDEYKSRVANAIYAMQEADLAQRQANDAAAQSKSEIAREMMRAREEARAAASAAGVTGNTLNRMLTDISFTEQQKKALADANRNNIVDTQQLQKHKAIQGSKVSPFYYTDPGGGGGSVFNSMFSIVPALFSGLTFTANTSSSSSCHIRN